MEKKKRIRAGIVGLAGVVLLGGGAFWMTHVSVDGAFFPRNAEVFDLTGHELSAEEYLDLQQRFPDAEILWTVPFQGQRYALDTEAITVTSLTEADARNLAHLHNLKQVDATQCTDYAALVFLQEYLPECSVLYRLPLTGGTVRSDTQHLTVVDTDAAELELILPLLPQLRSLTLEGKLPKTEELLHLQAAFPSVKLIVTLNIGGQDISTDTKSMDLSGAQITMQELTALIPLFADASELVLKDTSLTDAELKALIGQYPEIFFLCDLDFAGKPVSTDSAEIDLSGCSISVEEVEALLPCFPRLKKLDMSHCGIDDEAMDALNQRHPDISIVWTLQLDRVTVRTDATVFFPSKHGEHNLPSDEALKKLRFCRDMIAIDIGHSKATNCDWAANMPHLRYLILADTKITDLTPLSNLKELLYLEAFSLNLTDYSPLLGCTSLQDLNIGTTFADPEPLTKMPWLHNLFWHGILKDPDLAPKAQKLAEQLPDTNIVLETPRKNIGGMWRYLPHYYVFRDFIDGDFFNQEYVGIYLDKKDSQKILACDHGSASFAGDVLAEIVRYRIDNKLPITGIKNVGSEKAEILYQSLRDSHNW